MKLRTADHAPACPAELTPRTRQKWVTVDSPVTTRNDDVTLWSRTSGALNALESSIWILYETASATSFQSNVIGCGCDDAFDGVSNVGAAGSPGGAGGVDVVALMSIFVTNASPQKIERSPLNTRSNAPTVAGKSWENVDPVT